MTNIDVNLAALLLSPIVVLFSLFISVAIVKTYEKKHSKKVDDFVGNEKPKMTKLLKKITKKKPLMFIIDNDPRELSAFGEGSKEYEIVVFQNPMKALYDMQHEDPAIIVVNNNLKEITGEEFSKIVKQLYNNGSKNTNVSLYVIGNHFDFKKVA